MSTKENKKKITDLGEGKITVMEYLKKEYRPYAISDLILNLHSQISKPNMVKILDSLVSEGTIVGKVYGKSSFYCYQEIDEHNDDEPAQVDVDQTTFMELKKEIEELEKDYNDIKKAIQIQESKPSQEHLAQQISDSEKVRNVLQMQIKELQDRNSKLNTGEVKKHFNEIKAKHTERMSRYLVCLKMYKNINETIKDSIEDPVKFLNTIGVEKVSKIDF